MIKITNSQTTQNTNTEGNTTFELNLNTPGKYTAQATFPGDTIYGSSSSTVHSFKVPNSSSTKTTPNIVMTCLGTNNTIYWSVSETYRATVTSNGSAVSGVTVYFVYLNNNDNSPVSMGNAVTNSNGVAEISFTSTDKTDGSEWRMYAYIEADNTYNYAKSSNIVVTNKRIPTSLTLSASPSQHTTSGTSTLTATLKNTLTNTGLNGKTITFVKGGTSLGTATTDANGVATKTTGTLTSTTSFTASFEEPTTDGIKGATGSATVTVTNAQTVQNTTLSVTSINNSSSLPLGSTLSITGRLTTEGGTPINGATVTMNITSTSDSSVNINVTGSTDSNGYVTLTRAVTGAGTWKVKLLYSGSSGTYNASNSSTYTVTSYNQYATSITGLPNDNSSLSYGDVLDPVLRDYAGNHLNSKSVSVSLSWSNSFPSSGTATYPGTTGSDGKMYRSGISYSGVKLELSSSGTLYVKVTFTDSTYDDCTITRQYTYTGA